ncbi:DUF397 domain-containing protein [Spirillospora sp. NPDC052269]
MINWRKSSYSANSGQEDCVELARVNGRIGVRDSRDPVSGYLSLHDIDFAGLVAHVKTEGAGKGDHAAVA